MIASAPIGFKHSMHPYNKKQLLTFMEVNTGLYSPNIQYDIALPRSGNTMNIGSI